MDKKKAGFYTSINIIGFVLMFIAGWIDTLAVFLFFNENTSFMTGRVAKLGMSIFSGDKDEIKNLLLVLAFFILGAFVSTLVTKKNGLCGGLYLSGAIIISTAILFFYFKEVGIALIAISLSMGAQNAATSLTPVNRTTHLTGPITDIGINLAKGNWKVVFFWMVRFSAFILGTMISYKIIAFFDLKTTHLPLTMMIPGALIILTGFFQKKIFDIPLLNEGVY